jgi:hypothetical protein
MAPAAAADQGASQEAQSWIVARERFATAFQTTLASEQPMTTQTQSFLAAAPATALFAQ